jgi:GAF domain-containing protein
MPPFEPTRPIAGDAEEFLRRIATGVGSLVGEAFFARLVQLLRETLECDFVFVGRVDSRDDPRHVTTVAVQTRDGAGENFTYGLGETPCEQVAGGRPCVIANRARTSRSSPCCTRRTAPRLWPP